MSGFSYDWTPLSDALAKLKSDKSDDAKKEFESVRTRCRTAIAARFDEFMKDKFGVGNFFDKNKNGELIKKVLEDKETPETEKENLRRFERFTTYFTGFFENRRNVFSSEAIATSIPFRIVHQNFEFFIADIAAYEKAPESVREELKESFAETEYGNVDFAERFSINGFNRVLTQTGITEFNEIVGGLPAQATEEKTRGFNEILNLYLQQHPEDKKRFPRMKLLYKQILSDSDKEFFRKPIESDDDLRDAIEEQRAALFDAQDGGNGDGCNVLETLKNVAERVGEFDLSKIWIPERGVRKISQALFAGDWDALHKRMRHFEENRDIGKKETEKQKTARLEKWEKRKAFSIAELNEIIAATRDAFVKDDAPAGTAPPRVEDFWRDKIEFEENVAGTLAEKIAEAKKAFADAQAKLAGADSKSQEDKEEKAYFVKIAVDHVLDFYHAMRLLEAPKEEKDRDEAFYAEFDEAFRTLCAFVPVYNKIRNYLTQERTGEEKFKLNFDCTQLADGWDKDVENAKHAVIFLKDGNYFLGILRQEKQQKDKKRFPKIDFEKLAPAPGEANIYKKMVYKQLSNPARDLPHRFFATDNLGKYNPPSELTDDAGTTAKGLPKKKKKKKVNEAKLIDFYKDSILKTENWSVFNFNFDPTDKYKSASEFLEYVKKSSYALDFIDISGEKLEQLVNGGRLFLFQIYNKDFSPSSTGTKNLHTLYWNAVFSEENRRKNYPFKLNGGAELFFRRAQLKRERVPAHKAESSLVGKIDKDGNTFTAEEFSEIYNFANGNGPKPDEALLARAKIRPAPHEIVKDRRYTEDKFFFHVPVSFNRGAAECKDKDFNDRFCDFFSGQYRNGALKIIGIDRGERNLSYVSVIDSSGKILEQHSFNRIDEHRTDYQVLLKLREDERQDARKNWRAIGKIAQIKEGYISQVVHKISALVVKYQAAVVLEDLNVGFKRGRFKFERQVYQKFEKALIEKLNYLAFKDRAPFAPGGIGNAFQLTTKFESFEKMKFQSGVLFYVPAGWTSKIDPTTGFINAFDLSGLTNTAAKHEFFSKFDSIRFDKSAGAFAFAFDYANFKIHQTPAKTKWTAFSHGERIEIKKAGRGNKWISQSVKPTELLEEAFNKAKIAWRAGEELVPAIRAFPADRSRASTDFWDALYNAFKLVLQMRNSDRGTGRDFIISPVKNAAGTFFNSEKIAENDTLPCDADANGAYHIALKGLLLVREGFWKKSDGKKSGDGGPLANPKWFKFVQNREFEHRGNAGA